MKKTLSVILAVILMFSAVSVMAFAAEPAEDMVDVYFYLDEADLDTDGKGPSATIRIASGESLAAEIDYTEDFPTVPEKVDTEGKMEYTFRYWKEYIKGDDGNWIATEKTHSTYTLPTVNIEDGAARYFVAIYHEEPVLENMTFWEVVAYIFRNFNFIFEYIAKIYEGIIEF